MVENPILHSSLQSTLTSPSNLSAMLLRQSRPSIRQLPERITSGHRNPFSDMVPGPTSPLERNPQSPKGWKNRESDGIGLGIVAALEKSDGGRSQAKLIVGAPILHVSAPIAVGSPRAELGCNWRCSNSGVACYGEKYGGFFCGSPPWGSQEIRISPMADFLSNCYLCRKKLHGKDIYMYRGEKAFCSMECRYQQIVNDEFQEKCGSEALRSSDVSSTSYTDDRLFFTGIAAA